MYEFELPDIGEGLSEAELLEWIVKPGDRVTEGDEVAMISTDKVNVDLSAPASGVVIELFGAPGEVIKVGSLIMRIDDGKNEAGHEAEKQGNKAGSTGISADRTQGSESPALVSTPVATVTAAPVVRRYAAEQSVDLAAVEGSGPGGQVLMRDVEAFLNDAGDFTGQRFKLSGPRLAAAQRLAHGDHVQVTSTIAFESLADALLSRLQNLSEEAEPEGVRLTPTALLARCTAIALGRHPHFNATISENGHELLIADRVNMGIAVDTPDGLMVPVIRNLDRMSVLEIAEAISAMSGAARSGRLALGEVSGSTFTLSSTGSLEKAVITATTPVINYPNAATLWLSRISERPRVRNGLLEAGPMICGSLSFDHRYLHGADGIAFVNELDGVFNHPELAV